MPLRINIVRTHDTHLDPPVEEPIRKDRLAPGPLPELPDCNKPRAFGDILPEEI